MATAAAAQVGFHGRIRAVVVAALALLVAVAATAWMRPAGSPGVRAARATRAAAAAAAAALPPAAREAVSRGLGAGEARYAVATGPAGVLTVAGAGGLHATFSRVGVALSGTAGAADLSLGLSAVGRGRSLVAVAGVAPIARANRVTYVHGGVTEWYANGPLGLEQGFTLARRPVGTGALSLVVGRVAAGARATLRSHGQSLSVGATRYGRLSVTDARGHAVPAWIALDGRSVVLRVRDRDATYPLTVDPLVAPVTLTATGSFLLGDAVAISADGTTIAAGATGTSDYAGAVYVFTEPASGWASATAASAVITDPNATAEDYFGSSVALTSNGDQLVVGSAGANSGSGEAYLFAADPAGWSIGYATKTTFQTTDTYAQLGSSVAISAGGATIVAGADDDDSGSGAVYVYTVDAGGWDAGYTTAQLTASDGGFDSLGQSVAISADGSTIVAGAPYAQDSVGAVYVYAEPQQGWIDNTETAQLSVPASGTAPGVGTSVAVSSDGTAIAAGAPFADVGDNAAQGAVYVFTVESGNEVARLTASNGAANDNLGYGVAMSADGSTVYGGAPGSGGGAGSVYTFAAPQTGWADETESREVTAPEREFALGSAVAQAGSITVAGAPYDTATTPGHGTVDVSDPQPLGLTAAGIDVPATSPQGAIVHYAPQATWGGQKDPYATVSCDPQSGSLFALTTTQVRCTATDPGATGSPYQQSFDVTVSEPPAPVGTAAPAITGTVTDGDVLTRSGNGRWASPDALSYAAQWERCVPDTDACSAIGGATGWVYRLTAADVGDDVTVVVTATDPFGQTGTVTAAEVGPVTDPPAPVPVAGQAPVVSGTATDGDVLTRSSDGRWTSPDALTYAAQWERCLPGTSTCTPIGGATGWVYRLKAADVGYQVTVAVTATDSEGQTGVVTAAPSATVGDPPAPSPTADPAITGYSAQGDVLTRTSNGRWSSPDTLSFSAQWERCTDATLTSCAAITGATGDVYRLKAADIGSYVTVVVTATDQEGQTGVADAAAIGPVTLS